MYVDGGMTRNTFLMQLLANILGIPVGMLPPTIGHTSLPLPPFPSLVRPQFSEMTVRGAAIAAGLAVGVWPDTNSLPQLEAEIFTPSITQSGTDSCSTLSYHCLHH